MTSCKRYLGVYGLITAVFAAGALVSANPQDPHARMFEGRWTVTVFLGFEGPALEIPIAVSDRHRPRTLNQTFAVPGTTVRVTLRQYLPDLVWRETAQPQADGGVLVRLALRGPAMNQDIWLDSLDPQRQSVSASIGSVGMLPLKDVHTIERIRETLTVAGARLGLLRVWPLEEAPPLEISLDLGQRNAITVPGYTIKVLDYMSHYGIHLETGEVFDSPDKADNPALQVEVNDGKTRQTCWLWSRFPQFGDGPGNGHEQEKLPLRATFVDFERVRNAGRYTLIVLPTGGTFVLSGQEKRLRLDTVSIGQSFAFSDEAYSFTVEEVHVGAALARSWANNRERLLRPAVVVDIQGGGNSEEQVVLEIGKPHHHRTSEGTVTLHYGAKRPRDPDVP